MADGREDELIGLILRSIYYGSYCYPFTSEQISEITQKERCERNEIRLKFLADISRNYYFENSISQHGFRSELPKTVHKTINEVSLAENWEADFANIVTYDQQLEARTIYGLSTKNLNNLSAHEAIQTINSALASIECEVTEGQAAPPRSLEEILKICKENMSDQHSELRKEMEGDHDIQLRNTKIVCLFSLIDTFGFWSDLKATYKKGSRLPDSRHVYNGSYFNIVVSRDKRFLKKAEAAYTYFGISTSVQSTNDFKVHLRDMLSEKS